MSESRTKAGNKSYCLSCYHIPHVICQMLMLVTVYSWKWQCFFGDILVTRSTDIRVHRAGSQLKIWKHRKYRYFGELFAFLFIYLWLFLFSYTWQIVLKMCWWWHCYWIFNSPIVWKLQQRIQNVEKRKSW